MAKVSLRAYNREIEAMIDGGHLDEAVAHCQHILKTFPKHLETYRLLGKAYLEAKSHSEAVDIFSRVLAAEPNDFVAHVGMSIIRDEQSKLDDAIWHMERAFEVQSANPAIQGELQRLYGRRDGVQPPRIRMTRGALAHMYMRGELYPQAISETKGVLEEDQGRIDMQVLRAKAFYRSGQKNDAADAASTALKRYPYCLDANLVLAEILSNDRPESAQAYRQRVIELDPYAAQAVDNMFHASQVSDAAVSIEYLEWNGQPVGMSADWSSTQAIGLESGLSDQQPEWMKSSPPDDAPPSIPAFVSEQDASSTSAQPADDIPDFLRAAGWGESTGAFDESKSSAMFDDESAPAAEPLAQGDLPDWVKAMAPQETSQPAAEEQEEELPDWINKIGTGELPVPSAESSSEDQSDWLSGLDEPSDSQPSDDQPDWMKSIGEEEKPAPVTDDQPDWMKDFGEEEQPASASEDQPDWMKMLGDETEPAVSSQPSNGFDLPDELEPEEPAPSPTSTATIDTGSLGTSEEERDDSFAWLENLAAKQGATEGLLTKPEERLDDEPDWIKQAKGMSQAVSQPPAEEKPPVQQPPIETPQPAPAPQPPVNVEDLGKSGQEIDDALAWFESLAAKQGATEGLLTKPEERLEQEPEWVKQAKKSKETPPEPSMEGPVTTEAEPAIPAEGSASVDDVSSWLKGLDEEEVGQEPAPVTEDDSTAWLKSLEEPESEAITSSSVDDDELHGWMQDVSDEPVVPAEDAEASFESPVPVQESKSEGVTDWLSSLEEEEQPPAVTPSDDLPAWMRDDTGEVVAEPTKIEPTRATDWTPVDDKNKEAEAVQPPPSPQQPAPEPEPKPKPAPKAKKPAPKQEEVKPATPPEPYKEPVTRRGTGMLTMPVDPILGSARAELSRSNIPGALETYAKLIKKGRFLEEVIFDLREALYRYPVEVSIWQSLGDAYMRANQLQDALDAYTKAEELLR